MHQSNDALEVNIGSVVKVLCERPGLSWYSLTRHTRIELLPEDPLSLRETEEAICAAIQRGLIRCERKSLGPIYGTEEVYYSNTQ